MEIILKKTKITASILKQTLRPNINEFKCFDVIGWCVYDKQKWIVIFKDNDLKKLPLGFEVEVDKYNTFKVYFKVPRYIAVGYDFPTSNDAQEFIERLKFIKESAIEIGQFYI